jgi:hypothetical protein
LFNLHMMIQGGVLDEQELHTGRFKRVCLRLLELVAAGALAEADAHSMATSWVCVESLLKAPEGDKPAIDEPAHAPEKSSGGDEGGQGSAPS